MISSNPRLEDIWSLDCIGDTLQYSNNLSDSQNKLLELYGHHPELTEREMANAIGFKYYNYVSTVKTNILEKKGYLAGPYYYLNFKKISKEPVSRLLVYILFNKNYNYDFLIKLLKNIECWSFFYPLQESTFNELITGIYSTNHKKIIKILDYVKEKEIIYHYSVYELKDNLYTYNPRFFKNSNDGKEETKYDFDKIHFNDAQIKNAFEDKETNKKSIKFSELDTRLLMYLQTGHKNTELSKLMKHDAKIIDEEGNKPYIWGYNSWRYAYEKIKRENIIKKFYVVYPLPKNLCSYFMLLVKGHDLEQTISLGLNIRSGLRILNSGALVRSLNKSDKNEMFWFAHVRCHPIYMQKISNLLDIPQVEKKYIHYAKSISYHNNNKTYPVPYMNYYSEQSISLESKYYDYAKQAVNYDYDKYLENIKHIVERI